MSFNNARMDRVPELPSFYPYQHVVVIAGPLQPKPDGIARPQSIAMNQLGQTETRGPGRQEVGNLLHA